jgi:tryptophan synthase beta chain
MQTPDGQITEPYSQRDLIILVGPMHSHLATTGRAEFFSVTDDDAMQADLIYRS